MNHVGRQARRRRPRANDRRDAPASPTFQGNVPRESRREAGAEASSAGQRPSGRASLPYVPRQRPVVITAPNSSNPTSGSSGGGRRRSIAPSRSRRPPSRDARPSTNTRPAPQRENRRRARRPRPRRAAARTARTNQEGPSPRRQPATRAAKDDGASGVRGRRRSRCPVAEPPPPPHDARPSSRAGSTPRRPAGCTPSNTPAYSAPVEPGSTSPNPAGSTPRRPEALRPQRKTRTAPIQGRVASSSRNRNER